MKYMKYKILFDYQSEGLHFNGDTEYDTVDEAVKAALASGNPSTFLIVHVVDWKAIHHVVSGKEEPLYDDEGFVLGHISLK